MSQVELLRAVVAMLNEAGIPYMVVGSYASAFHGEPRMTRDIDMVIEPDGDSIKLLVDLVDRDRFYLGDAEEAVQSRSMFNLIEPGSGWKVDFVVRKDRPFSEVEFQRRFAVHVAGVEVFMATAEDTMLAKLEWGAASGSDRQMDDVIAIAANQELDRAYLYEWAETLGVSAELEKALGGGRWSLDLAPLVTVFEATGNALKTLGCTVSVEDSLTGDRPKKAIWLRAEGAKGQAHLTVWDSGEGELVSVSAGTANADQQRFERLTRERVEAILDGLSSTVV